AQSFGKGKSGQAHRGATFSEPLRRSDRVRLQEPPDEKQGVFARCAINGSGRIGMATNCMKCMVGSSGSPDLECRWGDQAGGGPASSAPPPGGRYSSLAGDEERLELASRGAVQEQQPRPQPDLHLCSGYGVAGHLPRTCQPLADSGKKNGDSKGPGGRGPSRQRWPGPPGGKYGSTVNLVTASNGSITSDSSSLESLGSPDCPKRFPESSRKQAGTLQREMNALFAEKLEEIRSKSPIFFTGKTGPSSHTPPSNAVDHPVISVSP
ncbi:uncharacterized protein LOC140701621, partial [Pogona vitticeps]